VVPIVLNISSHRPWAEGVSAAFGPEPAFHGVFSAANGGRPRLPGGGGRAARARRGEPSPNGPWTNWSRMNGRPAPVPRHGTYPAGQIFGPRRPRGGGVLPPRFQEGLGPSIAGNPGHLPNNSTSRWAAERRRIPSGPWRAGPGSGSGGPASEGGGPQPPHSFGRGLDSRGAEPFWGRDYFFGGRAKKPPFLGRRNPGDVRAGLAGPTAGHPAAGIPRKRPQRQGRGGPSAFGFRSVWAGQIFVLVVGPRSGPKIIFPEARSLFGIPAESSQASATRRRSLNPAKGLPGHRKNPRGAPARSPKPFLPLLSPEGATSKRSWDRAKGGLPRGPGGKALHLRRKTGTGPGRGVWNVRFAPNPEIFSRLIPDPALVRRRKGRWPAGLMILHRSR